MYVLIILILNTVSGEFIPTTILQTYSTLEECQSERDRITEAMEEAYPNDKDFKLTCKHVKGEEL